MGNGMVLSIIRRPGSYGQAEGQYEVGLGVKDDSKTGWRRLSGPQVRAIKEDISKAKSEEHAARLFKESRFR